MNISERGLTLIKSFEGLRLQAYMPTPDDVPTIGYGSTRGVVMGMEITKEEAHARLLTDLAEAEACVNRRCAGITITQGQYDALCSFVFNLGCRNFSDSTLLKRLLDGDDDGASKEFLKWNRQGNRVLAGLTRRRFEESELFRS